MKLEFVSSVKVCDFHVHVDYNSGYHPDITVSLISLPDNLVIIENNLNTFNVKRHQASYV